MASKEGALRSFSFAFEELEFNFYFVSSAFGHTACFSSVTFQLNIHTIGSEGQGTKLAVSLWELFGKEVQEEHTDQLEKTVDKLPGHPMISKVKVLCCSPSAHAS